MTAQAPWPAVGDPAAPHQAATATGDLHPPGRGHPHARRTDLATGKLFYRIRARKRWIEFLDLLKAQQVPWPGQKFYVVCDNFSPTTNTDRAGGCVRPGDVRHHEHRPR